MSNIFSMKPDKEAAKLANEANQQALEATKQAKAEAATLRKKTQQQSLDIMRSRFGAFSGASGGLGTAVMDTPANLYSRITGN